MLSSPATDPAPADKARKESAVAEEEKKNGGGAVVPSSYWGISRPKITREDGTEWPWNCFMVRQLRASRVADVLSEGSICSRCAGA